MKRLIQELFIIFITLLISFACATTSQNSPADKVGLYRNQFVKCTNTAIPKYLNKINDLNLERRILVQKAVMADCGYYLTQMVSVVLRTNPYAQQRGLYGYWEKNIADKIGKAYLLQKEGKSQKENDPRPNRRSQ